MIRHMDVKILPLTLELAQDVYSAAPFKGERRYKPTREKFLRARLDDGLFYPPRWSFVTIAGVRHRTNGQHSSGMLINAEKDGKFPQGMLAIVDEFEADSMLEVAQLFGQFDHSRCARTRGEIVHAHGRIHPELDEISATLLTICVSGIAYGQSGGAFVRQQSDDERASMIHQDTPFILWMKEFLNIACLARATVIGAIYNTYQVNRGDALEFWRWVRDESHVDPKHPSRLLAKFLRSNRSGQAGLGGWEPRAFYVKSIHAWNAYRRKIQTALNYHPKAANPRPV